MKKPIKSPVVWCLGVWSVNLLDGCAEPGFAEPVLQKVVKAYPPASGSAEAISLPALPLMHQRASGVALPFSASRFSSEREIQTVGNLRVAEVVRGLKALPAVAGQVVVVAAWVASHESRNKDSRMKAFQTPGGPDLEAGFEPSAQALVAPVGKWESVELENTFCYHLGDQEERRGWDRANGSKPVPLLQAVRDALGEVVLPELSQNLEGWDEFVRSVALTASLPAALELNAPRPRF